MTKLLVVLLCGSSYLYGAFAFVASDKINCTGACSTSMPGMTTTGATSIWVTIGNFNDTNTCDVAVAPTDNKSNTYVATNPGGTPYNQGGNQNYSCLFYASAATGAFTVGASHIISVQGNFMGAVALAFSGTPAASSPLDNAGGTGATGTSIQPGSLTPSDCNMLVVSGFASNGTATGALAVDSGFATPVVVTNLDGGNASLNVAMSYLIETSIVAVNPQWSDSGNSTDMTASLGIFKSSAGCAGANVKRKVIIQ